MRLHSTAGAKPAFDQLLVQIPSRAENRRFYLTWQPIEATASVPAGGSGREIMLRNASSNGGTLVFSASRTGKAETEMCLTLEAGTPASFWIAGGTASSEDGDAVLEIIDDGTKKLLATVPMMVRIRKNANSLTPGERARFVKALAEMNRVTSGTESTYRIMRNMHREGMDNEAHLNPAFLPWHRAFVLDFERELQAIDQSVALHYWRFDEAAPNVFTQDFMGARRPSRGAYAVFAADNPLLGWATDTGTGIRRRARRAWNPNASGIPTGITQDATVNEKASYFLFREMESDPHGRAHTSWNGFLSQVPTSPLDPLFFMLHSNVDRLWALWQSADLPIRANPDEITAFDSINKREREEFDPREGHHLDDTMWPWNGHIGEGIEKAGHDPRPTFVVGGVICASKITPNVPPDMPTVRSMIDYQGVTTPVHLGFDYYDVPFKRAT